MHSLVLKMGKGLYLYERLGEIKTKKEYEVLCTDRTVLYFQIVLKTWAILLEFEELQS